MTINRSISGRTIAQGVMFALALGFVAIGLYNPKIPANGNYSQPTPPPPPPPPPRVELPPPRTFTPGIVVSTDVTNNLPNPNAAGIGPNLGPAASSGLNQSNEKNFPQTDKLGGSTDFILVKPKPDAVFHKLSEYAVNLKTGAILVGVKKPSETGVVETEFGRIAIFSNADAIISIDNGVLRVLNFDGLGENIRVLLTGPGFANLSPRCFSLRPGFELIASNSPLSKKDLRPNDGVGRRHTQLIGNKHVAINQFSPESAIKGSALIASLNQSESSAKEKRILADMSKMAAVLNQVHGTWGYEGGQKTE